MDIFKDMEINKILKNYEEETFSNQVFNANQCKNLVHHLRNFIQRFQEMFDLDTRAFRPLLKDVCKVSSKVEMLVQSCSQTSVLAPLIQMHNKEAFRELLLEMASCFEVLYDIASNIDSCLKKMENIVDFQSCVTNFLPCDLVEVKEDQDELCKILENKLYNLQPESCDYKLANYVLHWRECILKVEGGESDLIQFLPNVPLPDFGPFPISLAKDVFLTKWLGVESVTKKINLDGYDDFDIIKLEKEARIMAQLNHPNIVKLFYCGSFKDSLGKSHLQFGMEKGEKSLHKMLFEDPNQKITFHAKLDIILQIVSGMLYLHDMKVAHRDLKPANVVVNPMQCQELQKDGYVCVKLIDFGISKDEVKDNILVIPTSICGTYGYRAPEATNPNVKLDPLKTDVFSFGLLCCDIFIQKQFKGFGCSPFEIAKKQKLALLDIQFCQELRSLIENCLSMDPNGRPSFAKIYTRLMEIKKKDFKTQYNHKKLMQEDQSSHSKLFQQLSFPIRKWWLYIWSLIKHFLVAFIFDYIWRLYTPKINDECIKGIIDSSIVLKCHGLDFKIKTLEKFLQNKSMVGVIGVSGIGKTTLVKALKDRLSKALSFNDSFKWTVIMCDLKSDYLIELNRILKELGQIQEVKDLIEGKLILKSMFQQKKILFILDDVIEENQIDMFLEKEMFGLEGSKLIVTSRDWRILKGMISEDCKFEVPVLSHDQSIEIFSKHAFKNECAMRPLLNQFSEEIVRACGGHPLSLEVMGSCLNEQKRLRVWERALQKLKRGEYDAHGDVEKRLEVSFDLLSNDEQEVFLDISCFFCKDVWFEEIQEDTIVDYLNGNTKTIIASLRDNSLIKKDDNGFISMHDSIRDMGRKISRTRFGGRRKWKQTSKSLQTSKKEEFQKIRGICITGVNKENDLNEIENVVLPELMLLNIEAVNDLSNVAKLIKKTCQLKLLRITYKNDFDHQNIKSGDANQLKILLQLQELRQLAVLHLQNLQMMKTFPNTTIEHMPLKTLCLQNCDNLTTISYGLQNITSLTSLYIQRCTKLTSINNKFENLKALKTLSFVGCAALKNMPQGLGKLTCLQNLWLNDCQQLKIVNADLESLMSLTTLDLKGCEQLEDIPPAIAHMSCLDFLSFGGCKKLKGTQVSFENLKALKSLDFEGCEVLENMPQGLGKLTFLEKLWLNDCKKLKIVNADFESLTSLTTLVLEGCEQLEDIPPAIAHMSCLDFLSFGGCKKLKGTQVSFENLKALKILDFEGCEVLENMPQGLGKLTSLEELSLNDCKQLKIVNADFESLTSLTTLVLKGCEQLEDIPPAIAHMSCLDFLSFGGCKKLKGTQVSFENLKALKSLDFEGCEVLENMPQGLGKLTSLEELSLNDCKRLKIVNADLESLTSLTTLFLEGCEQLEDIPPAIAHMSCLHFLSFSGCKNLKRTQISFENLKALKTLNFKGCEVLENMPQGLGKLTSLEKLWLKDCKQLKIVNGDLESLTSLTTLILNGCEQLEEIPPAIAHMSCLHFLCFGGCKKLKGTQVSFENLKALKSLDFGGCEVLENMPQGLGSLTTLEELSLNDCKQLKIVNADLESLTSLTKLNFKGCKQLEKTPPAIAHMSCLD